MSAKYPFSELSPFDFQFLCRDLLQRHISEETNTKFILNTPAEGPDKGIDGLFQNTEHQVVLQCKRYKRVNTFMHNLKNQELEKVKKRKPTRYIVATSLELSQACIDEIFSLFQPYIQSTNDIIGRNMLTNLLQLYPDIILNYPGLFLNSTTILNRILHGNIYFQSKWKLEEFYRISKYYVPNNSFIQAKEILKKNHYVIISGEPGVGKTTIAGMLSLYYFQQDYEFVFIRRSISEAGNVWNDQKKQIFLFDDFLGDTSFKGFERNESREIFDFINVVRNSTGKYLLITTREYIFRQAETEEADLKDLNFTKCMVKQQEFTNAFKIHILYNYLYFSPVEFKHIEPFIYGKNYEKIITHQNFTPRLIFEYINKYYDHTAEGYELFRGLIKYLDNPYDYWERIFLKLSPPAQMILLILSITEEPVIEEFLFQTFEKVNEHRKLFEKGHGKDTFNQGLAELKDTFISIRSNPDAGDKEDVNTTKLLYLILSSFQSSKYVEFQNPSIKDFAIHYLRKNESLIKFLINGATTFNQLFYQYTTNEKYKDSDVGKIYLNDELQTVVIDRLLNDFDDLPIVTVKIVNWEDKTSSFHLDEGRCENDMEKLTIILKNYSPEYIPVIKNFCIKKYHQITEERKKDIYEPKQSGEYYSKSYLPGSYYYVPMDQVEVIKALSPYIEFDPVKTVQDFHDHILYAREYIALYELGKLFPEGYEEVITKNIKVIRSEIRNLLLDDIDLFLWHGSKDTDDHLNRLLYKEIDTLSDLYKFGFTKAFKKRVNRTTGENIFL